MYDFVFVKNFQSLKNLKCDFPDKCFLKPFLVFLLVFFVDFTFQITPIRILHHNTKRLGFRIEKGSLVLDNVGDVDGCQKSYFVERVFLLFLGEAGHRNGFESIDILVCFLADKLDISKTA